MCEISSEVCTDAPSDSMHESIQHHLYQYLLVNNSLNLKLHLSSTVL